MTVGNTIPPVIGRLVGRLASKATDHVILDVGGVGYLVQIPLSTFYELPEAESPASLWIHTHVREDALALYGFLTERERSLFLMLIDVAGIGPRVALTVLSGIPPTDLVEALRGSDVRRLMAVPGVGKKTAEDRKSTRLNSSHSQISYAVFCLKKKKNRR